MPDSNFLGGIAFGAMGAIAFNDVGVAVTFAVVASVAWWLVSDLLGGG